MGVGYTWEKLHTAAMCLADEGTLAHRLAHALEAAAALDRDEGAFPTAELRERWRKVVFTLTQGVARPEWRAAVERVSDDDRRLAAHEIVELAIDVARLETEDDLHRRRGLF